MSGEDEGGKLTKEEIEEMAKQLAASISFTSTRGLRHRVCIDCYSSSINSISTNGVEEIKCGKCGSIQPLEQPPLTKSDWEYIVGKGAPEFYLRNQEDVVEEIGDDHYINIFRKNNAHPYEASMPEGLRDICHIYYDEVRQKSMQRGMEKEYTNRGLSHEHFICLVDHFKKWNPRLNLSGGLFHGREDLGPLTISDIKKICKTDNDSATSIFQILKPEREAYNRRRNFKQ